MIDLTGANLVSYLLRIIRDIVEKNPRFRASLGNVTFPANSNPTTALRWKDVQVIIKSVTTSGTRLSFDYFMETQLGRAILCKVADKNGLFVEWTKEIDTTRKTPEAGVYYMNIDYVSEETRDIGLTVQKYKWSEGRGTNAHGTVVTFRPNILDPSTTSPPQQVDLNTLIATDSANSDNPVQFAVSNSFKYDDGVSRAFGGTMTLITPCTTLSLKFSNGTPLIPDIDYWFVRSQSMVICQSTLGGSEILSVVPPDGISTYESVIFTDQDDYELRRGIDYNFYGGPQWIQLSQWSPPGSTITANMQVKLNPQTTDATDPENILNVGMAAGESLVENQVFIHTTAGDFLNVPANPDGTITIPSLLQPGDCFRYEVRINAGQFKAIAKKWEINSLAIVDPNTIEYAKPDAQGVFQPVSTAWVASATPEQLQGVIQTSAGKPLLDQATKQQSYVLPGLWLAFGDIAVVGDQAAVIVSPTVTETYQVYGSKENLSFTLEIKSNDFQTSSDLSEMIKQYLLITSRINMESDGLTVFEATRDWIGEARDSSGTASNYVYTVTVSAAADWKLFKPLMTRLLSFEIIDKPVIPDFLGKLTTTPRIRAFGATSFIPAYV